MAAWVKVALDNWASAAEIAEGYIFRSYRKGDVLAGTCMASQTIWGVVTQYAGLLGQ